MSVDPRPPTARRARFIVGISRTHLRRQTCDVHRRQLDDRGEDQRPATRTRAPPGAPSSCGAGVYSVSAQPTSVATWAAVSCLPLRAVASLRKASSCAVAGPALPFERERSKFVR